MCASPDKRLLRTSVYRWAVHLASAAGLYPRILEVDPSDAQGAVEMGRDARLAVSVGRNLVPARPAMGAFVVPGSPAALPFRASTFDVVLTTLDPERDPPADSPVSAIAETARVLKPSGTAVIWPVDPDPDLSAPLCSDIEAAFELVIVESAVSSGASFLRALGLVEEGDADEFTLVTGDLKGADALLAIARGPRKIPPHA